MDLTGKTRNNFLFLKMIGKGHYGQVYMAEDQQTNQRVAIKVMDIRQIHRERMTEKIRFEIKLLKMFDHPNILSSKRNFSTSDKIFIVMEHFKEGGLQEILDRVGKFPEIDAIFIISQVLAGLMELHVRKILHRDIKPDNVLKDRTRFALADFGFSKEVEDLTETPLGTPLYEAPEILVREPYNYKVDLWAVGATFYYLVMGHPPFDVGSKAELLPAIQAFCGPNLPFEASISDPCRHFIRRLLEYDKNARMSWEELLSHPLFALRSTQIPLGASLLNLTQEEYNDKINFLMFSGKRNKMLFFDDSTELDTKTLDPRSLPQSQPEQGKECLLVESWLSHEMKLLKSTLKAIDLMRGLPIPGILDSKTYLSLFLLRIYEARTQDLLASLAKFESPLKMEPKVLETVLQTLEIKNLLAEFKKDFQDLCRNCRDKIMEIDFPQISNVELATPISKLQTYDIQDRTKFFKVAVNKFVKIFVPIQASHMTREQAALFYQAFAVYFCHINFENFAFLGENDLFFDWEERKNWIKRGNHEAYITALVDKLKKQMEQKSPNK